MFTFILTFSTLSLSQSILSLLRHHQAMSLHEQALKQEVADWNKALKTSTSLATDKSKQQEGTIKELSASLRTAVEETKKEKSRANEALQAVEILNKSLEMVKTTEKAYKKDLDGLGKDKLDL